MAEIAYELSGSVKYMISSESFGPQSGWPYGRIIERLNQSLDAGDGKASAEGLGSMTVDEHVDFYVEYAMADGLSVDISMLDVRQVDGLRDAIKILGEELRAELKIGKEFLDQIILAHWEAQSYNGEVYVDLRDFCQCLRNRYNGDVPLLADTDPNAASVNKKINRRKAFAKVCDDTVNAIKALVRVSCFMGVQFQYSFGVSIYFPWSEVDPDYNEDNLMFVKDSGWKDFLKDYVERTRRLPRGVSTSAQNQIMGLEPVRKTVTDQKGPANILTRSMRNPPINVIDNAMKDCTSGLARERPPL
jgi:hypothetical protein